MRYATIMFCAINLLGGVQAQSISHQFAAQISTQSTPFMNRNSRQIPPTQKRIVIAASMLLDGKGHVLKNTRIVIEGSKIVEIDPKAGPVDYDLRGLTVLPGWIDAHVHITWSFGRDGKSAGASETTQDVHQASMVIVVLNGAGKVVMESIIETGADTVRSFIKQLRGKVYVTFEEGTQATWLYDVLRPMESEVVVCDPRQNKLLKTGNKSDRVEARKLAELLGNG